MIRNFTVKIVNIFACLKTEFLVLWHNALLFLTYVNDDQREID